MQENGDDRIQSCRKRKTLIKETQDYRPVPGRRYFHAAHPARSDFGVMTSVVPFYNEEREELERCLLSLHRQEEGLARRKYENFVLIVMDGLERASQSMRAYLAEMFPALTQLYERLDALLQDPSKDKEVLTFIVQNVELCSSGDEEKKKKKHCVAVDILPTSITPHGQSSIWMNLSLIIKLDNRQKNNSHEWFFQAFAREFGSYYTFATDCGTLFADDCLYLLTRFLDLQPKVSACTGRQRAMTAIQQECDESCLSLSAWYRAAQCYDYEYSFACYMSPGHLAGMLPVIPGPCGLYRFNDIKGQALDWYFDVLHTPPEGRTIVKGNLLLAEDRVLSYAVALKTPKPRFTAIVPEATFYFAAETDLKQFVLQRRRWCNGTLAGYLFLSLYNSNLIWESPHKFSNKLAIWLTLLCQLLIYMVFLVSPAIFITSLKFSLNNLWYQFNIQEPVYTALPWYAVIILYMVFVVRHRYTIFDSFLFYCMLFFNALTILLAAFAVFMTVFSFALDPTIYGTLTVNGQHTYAHYLVVVLVAAAFFPILLALLHSWSSFRLMMKNFVPFYVFLPTLVATFGAYSIARTFDLTWGNRPTSERKRLGSGEEERARARAALKLQEQSSASCGMVVVFNVGLVFLAMIADDVSLLMLILGTGAFFFSGILMVVSFLWFLHYIIRKRLCGGCRALFRCCRPSAEPERVTGEDEEKEKEKDDWRKRGKHSFKSRAEEGENGSEITVLELHQQPLSLQDDEDDDLEARG